MKLKRSISGLIAIFLALSFLQTNFAWGKDISGTKCPIAGKTTLNSGFTYTCAQKGKNKIWAKISVPNIKNESTDISNTGQDNLKLESFFNALKAQMDKAEPKYELNINVDPQLSNSQWSKDSISSIESALKIWKVLGVSPSQKTDIYISWGTEYLAPYLPSSCIGKSGGGACGPNSLFADLKWFATNWGYGGVEKSYKSEMDKVTINANVPHELAHIAQSNLPGASAYPDNWKFRPAWLREGEAEYFKLLSYAYSSGTTYKYLHNLYASNIGKSCLNVPLADLTGQGSYSNGCEYSKGLFAAEYLALKYGSIKSLFLFSSANGNNAETIFKNAYGFNLSDFEKEADAYFEKVMSTH